MKYVIIGNGSAAISCIEGIREHDTAGEITVISGEAHHAYCRPLISYYLENKTDTERMKYRPDTFYDDMGCRLIYGRAASIAPDGTYVALEGGSRIVCDRICVAAGSAPFVPPFGGLDTVKRKFTFMTLDDALALEAACRPDSRVLIVGAGLIGLKCAEGLAGRVGSITVCDLAPRVLSSILDDGCAAVMQERLESHGIKFMLGDSADFFEGNTAHMKSDTDVQFDLLVLAVGVRANTSLVADAGGSVGRGIRINNRMETSLRGVYAAGDCTEGRDISLGGERVLALLPNANLQGRCAGANMAGGSETFDCAIPMNSIGFFGLHAMTAGTYFSAEEGGTVKEIRREGGLRRFFMKDGYLTEFILIGDIARAGIYTSLIRHRVPLCEVDFPSIAESPSLIAFSDEYRRKTLGGVV